MRQEPGDEDDESALRWDGDEELGRMTSLDEPASAPAWERPGLRPTAAAPPRDEPVRERDRPLAIVTGLFAVLFLAETVGWILVIQGVQSAGSFATGTGILDFLNGMARFLALLAAPLWFVAARLTSRRRMRIGWLALGVGVLVPWPLLLGYIA